MTSRASLGRALPAGYEKWSFLSTQTGETTSGVLSQVLGFPVKERDSFSGASPAKGLKDD